MTQQFKFGDRVKRFPTPESIGVVLSEEDEYGYVNVMFDDALEVEDFPVSGLELIPHPDTVRLDWLADLSNPANPIARVVPIEIYLGKRLNGLRDAIDAAMQIQAAETA